MKMTTPFTKLIEETEKIKERPSERYNVIDFIKDELADNKGRLQIFLEKQLRKRKHPVSSYNIDKIKLRIWKLNEVIKSLSSLSSIPINLYLKRKE